MTVFSVKQVVPVDYEAEVSQRLLDAASAGDAGAVSECVSDPFVDVNYAGAVTLKSRRSDVVLRGESPCEVRVEYEELKTDVTPLFLAVHAGNLALVRKLLSVGADVNQKLFRGYATTAAAREGHLEILQILLKAGASQPACEEALLKACCHGWARLVEVIMGSDLIRPNVAVHALVTASCRGFVDVVDTLMKCGVNIETSNRSLLLSSKPSLHTNVDCTALVAAIVSRQASVVAMLLKAGARTDVKVQIGAWSWDTTTGEEFRVGAGLAEPYAITWCAVEYFEATGCILKLLLKYLGVNEPHHGRTLLHHAILCGNAEAVTVLLNTGAAVESPVKTAKAEFRPLHMAARLGIPGIVQCLVDAGCELNSRTDSGDTALMICSKYKNEECLRIIAMAGADFGLLNTSRQSACTLAQSGRWSLGFQQCLLNVIRDGTVPKSTNNAVFSLLAFVANAGDTEALKVLIKSAEIDLDHQDDDGFSAVMYAALNGHVEAFRLLVYAGANVKLSNKAGQNAISLSELNHNRNLFEKVMLEFTLEKGNRNAGGFYALHYAARCGDLDAVKRLTSRGYDVNVPDGNGYTPLMLAAREGHGQMCELLISRGAQCDYQNARGESALSLARKHGGERSCAVNAILDELARKLVLGGSPVRKHTKCGKGASHEKNIVMVVNSGVFRWGKSSRRNVVCRDAVVGPSTDFRRNRRRRGDDADAAGVFRVLTTKNKEFHFVCDGGLEMAELWVRGIKMVTRQAICG